MSSTDPLHFFLKGYRSSSPQQSQGKGSPEPMDLLEVFARRKTASLALSEISSWLGISRLEAGRLASELEKKGLVSVKSSEIDDVIELTARGQAIAKELL